MAASEELLEPDEGQAFDVANGDATGQFVIVCEHASNRMPRRLGTLGLEPSALEAHVAWDPGALALADVLAERLRAPRLAARFSRLAHDVNRPPASPAAMPEMSERYPIPGNVGLDEAERMRRARALFGPFHDALDALLEARTAAGRQSAIATVHSFTPTWFGRPRETEIGILHDADTRLADALLARLAALAPGRQIARNVPYGPEDGVTYTLRRHGLRRGLPNVMIEIRSDLLSDANAVARMGALLAQGLEEAAAGIGLSVEAP
ncbi:MAG: N-formylglutamate amidohydrolase [Alphaproteobacteria bacterium]|nr:MAG: N-formylglutamate amidohydrolase [Alphaproteobacteria bacterium]